MSESTRKILQGDAKKLAQMMDLEGPELESWGADELSAVLRHQLETPILFDLEGCDSQIQRNLHALVDVHGHLRRSFGSVLHLADAPVELLVLTKEFAKSMLAHPDSAMPTPIAEVLYYASIAAALVWHNHWISQLSADELAACFRRLAAQPWVDDATRQVLQAGIQKLPGWNPPREAKP
jgi:hypothetical protein